MHELMYLFRINIYFSFISRELSTQKKNRKLWNALQSYIMNPTFNLLQ